MKKVNIVLSILVVGIFCISLNSCGKSDPIDPPIENMKDPEPEPEPEPDPDPDPDPNPMDDYVWTGSVDATSTLDELSTNVTGQIGDQGNWYSLNELTTDEIIVPTRGTDWNDNGQWRILHTHEWGPEHNFIINVWNEWHLNISLASQAIHPNSQPSPIIEARAKFMRALSMFVILDLYGQVLYKDLDTRPEELPEVLSGIEAIDFITKDLEEAIPNLPAGAVQSDANGDIHQSTARFLLAKVFLNAHIYKNEPQPNATDMQQVISLVDLISAEGYSLQAGYFDIFRSTPDTETIWYLRAPVGNRIYTGLHYNQALEGGGGWNGFATLAEFYDLFEGDANSNRVDLDGNRLDGQEERRGGVPPSAREFSGMPETTDFNGFEAESNIGNGFLINQQYAHDGTELTDRSGNPLQFTRDFVDGSGGSSITNNSETTGIRVMKYNPAYGSFNGHMIFFRYADAHLMKAEAMMRTGGDPTAMVNELRTLRGAQPLPQVNEENLLEERARELYNEGWRRNDLIRFGQFTKNWQFKSASAIGNENRNLFPIPESALAANPFLVQNPGY